ncbi:MAG: AMP-binding protein, partial [Rhodocyclaceae bacterium]|nr:AMP-binding protein [Rhodocyclaceae bacterium]
MLPIRLWLRRAPAHAAAIVLPDATTLSFGELARLSGLSGVQPLRGEAGTLARGLIDAAVGGGTALPLPPDLAPAEQARLLARAQAAAHPRLALIIATSGSSGAPKAVRLPWRALTAAARLGARAFDLRPGDAWLVCLPLYFIGGAAILYRCLRAGATAVVQEGFQVEAVARALHEQQITHVSLVPAMLARLLDAAVLPGPTLRCALVGG